MNDKLKAFLKGIMGDMVVFALCVIYTLTAFVTIEATGKSIWQIIGEGVSAFLMGFFLNRALERQGIIEGDENEELKKACDKHSRTVDNVVPYIDKLEEWCDMKNAYALRHGRERILAEGSLKYTDYFDGDGATLEFAPDEDKLKNRHMRKIEIARIRTYYKALTLKLTRLTATALLSEGGRDDDPFYLGRSKIEYSKQSSRKDVLTKIILAVLFGYYGVTLIANFSIANLIWKVFQVVMFLVIGSVKKNQAYSYVVEEYKGRIVKKTIHLQAFLNYEGITQNKGELNDE